MSASAVDGVFACKHATIEGQVTIQENVVIFPTARITVPFLPRAWFVPLR